MDQYDINVIKILINIIYKTCLKSNETTLIVLVTDIKDKIEEILNKYIDKKVC